MRNVSRDVSFFDHFLMAVAAVLTVYSAGISITRIQVSLFFSALILGGTLVGYVAGRLLRNTKLAEADGVLYFFAAILTLVSEAWLNGLAPQEGFPRELVVTSSLCWLITVGTLFSWRDQTLCFQAVPCITVFGFVGAFDIFKAAPFLFFLFLLCIASLFFRAHARTMMEQAEESLRPLVPGANRTRLREFVQDALRGGAWRWMAGPGWALGSALSIVAFSLLGAPIIRNSVQGVAGAVRLAVPASMVRALNPTFTGRGGTFSIGRGPTSDLNNMRVLAVRMDEPALLRTRSFYTYNNWSWEVTRFNNFNPPIGYDRLGGTDAWFKANQVYPEGRPIRFEVRILSGSHSFFYVPGGPVELEASGNEAILGLEGAIFPREALIPGDIYRGIALAPGRDPSEHATGVPPTNIDRHIFFQTDTVPRRVIELAQELTSGLTSDYAKAMAIKAEIERRCRYNLQAPAVPPDMDAVAFFLFRSREGYCDLFASAMAILARGAGLPSRVCTGFLVQPSSFEEGQYIVRAKDYHAWAEIYFRDVGWVAFDATEGADQVSGAGVGEAKQDLEPWYRSGVVRTVVDVVTLGSIVGLCWSAFASMALWRAGLRRAALDPRSIRRSQAWKLSLALQKSLRAKSGTPRRLSSTPNEYLEKIAPKLGPVLTSQAFALSARLDRALFSAELFSEEEMNRLRQDIRDFARRKVAS